MLARIPSTDSKRVVAVGIDFGSEYASIAYLNDGGQAQVIPIDGQARMPSVVLYNEDGRVVVGHRALEQAAAKADRVVQAIKLSLGQAQTRRINGVEYTPEQITADILKK